MAITNGYATLVQIKARLGITGSGEDTLLEEAVQSASREIDKHCHRRFYLDSSATARVYYPRSSCHATVDDISTTTGLVIKTDTAGDGTYATTWVSADYELSPLNGVVDSESGWPYYMLKAIRSLRFTPQTTYGPAPLQVTAKWGWAAVPDPVYQACLIMATANYKLKDSAFGSVGIGELGIVTVRQTPAAMAKLVPYRLNPVLVG